MAGPPAIRRYQAKGGVLQNLRSGEASGAAKSSKKQESDGESDSASLSDTVDANPSKKQASDRESDSESQPGTEGSQSDLQSAGGSGGGVSVTAIQPSAVVNSGTPPVYESPMKRVRRAIELGANKRVIDTARDLKAFILAEDPNNRGVPTSVAATIALRLRVVWTSFESYSTGVVWLHLTDKCESASVKEMHKVFKEDYAENKNIVDSELVTVSLYGVDDTAAGLPDDGTIIFISKVGSLKLFAKQSCQLSTSADAIKAEE